MRALYRRYRPKSLDEVVGQEQVTKVLKSSLEAGKVGHAYLFVGPRGCGKTSVARILAHEVNGFKYEIEDDYVDIIEIDGASNRGIDDIRELREKVMIAPTTGKYKIYIIDEVHMLTKEAFNALLKTLEEPPEHAIFIMATTDAYKVPVTITSRAQTYTFKLADSKTMLGFLRSVAEKEKIAITDEALEIVVRRGGGSFRDSLSLLDQLSTLSGGEITKDMVTNAMGLPQDEQIKKLLDEYASGNLAEIATTLQNLLHSGVKAETLTEEMVSAIVANPKPELLALLKALPNVKAPYAEAKLLVALTENIKVDIVKEVKVVKTAEVTATASESATSEPKPAVPTSAPVLATPAAPFEWGGYVAKVQNISDAVYSQLVKTQYEFDGSTLHIYPMKRIIKSILSRENNKRILIDAAEGQVKITIHSEDETPSNAKKDELLSKISDIMGGEVQNDGGGSPF